MGMLSGCGREEVQTYEVPKQVPLVREPVKLLEVPSRLGFEADMPASWQQLPGQGMRLVSYTIEGTEIDFYVIKLGMGDLTSNVNRWRGQIGLAEASAESIAASVKPLTASGTPVKYVELFNLDTDKGILAAIIDGISTYWYFTAKGSVSELKLHSADIQRFINSIRFN
tara:strand:- start:94 stop:600 length:507 start_codon:yes stop_codon:yes gene_type:complete